VDNADYKPGPLFRNLTVVVNLTGIGRKKSMRNRSKGLGEMKSPAHSQSHLFKLMILPL
jgi:hypothetical protein